MMSEANGQNNASQIVDMISSAKNAQWSTGFLDSANVVSAISPAKVNLILDVGHRREDGYHDVCTVLHALTLHDKIYIGETVNTPRGEPNLAGPSNNISVNIDIDDKNSGLARESDLMIDIPDNLAFKAIDVLARVLDINDEKHLNMRIEKNIPAQAGLGGGSSNAAATLLALARIWGVEEREDEIEEAARQLGADIPFFLKGGCASYAGRGDIFIRSLDPMNKPVVLVKPGSGVSTDEAYSEFDRSDHPSKDSLVGCENATSASEVILYNNLEQAAFNLCDEVFEVYRWVKAQDGVENRDGEAQCLLCGSGSCVFAIVNSFNDASRIAVEAKKRNWWARPTTFSRIGAMPI